MSDEVRRAAADQTANSPYAPGAEDEVTVPPNDPVREAKRRDLDDVADVHVDPEEWRQGGPTRSGGVATTTGGRAGPNTRPVRGHREEDGSRHADDEPPD